MGARNFACAALTLPPISPRAASSFRHSEFGIRISLVIGISSFGILRSDLPFPVSADFAEMPGSFAVLHLRKESHAA
jgi:hypothetical protein